MTRYASVHRLTGRAGAAWAELAHAVVEGHRLREVEGLAILESAEAELLSRCWRPRTRSGAASTGSW